MARRARGALRIAAAVAAAVLAALAAGPLVERFDVAWSLPAYQAVVVAIGVALGLLAVRPVWPQEDPRVPPPTAPVGRPHLPELDAIESLLTDASRHAGHLHHRLRPRLRALAADALASRQVDLDDPDGPAPALLGNTAWAWLGPQARPPAGRHGSGPGPQVVAELVAAVARLHGGPDGGPPR